QLLVFLAFLLFQAGCSSNTSMPAQYKVKFDTSKGPFTVEVHRDWAPLGSDRFYELVTTGFYDDARFFRVVPKFVVQFGISKDPKVSAHWREMNLPDDTVHESNRRGYLTYAKAGRDSRTTQVFVNLADNVNLDTQGFAPFGRVIEGMNVVDSLYSGYGDAPQQDLIQSQGNEYLKSQFPQLDYIKTAKIEN
ncbi:MAG TPA: peptidylprolyl isomerase, partial [Bryobacteraceae bacterium]